MEGRGGQQSHRKPRRGRGTYGRGRGQVPSPSPSPSPSTLTVSSVQVSPDVPDSVQQNEPVSVPLKSTPDAPSSSFSEVEQTKKPQTEEKKQEDPIIVGPSHQFEKSVRIHDAPSEIKDTKEGGGKLEIVFESGAPKIEEASSKAEIQETPKAGKAKEEYQPRVLVVEPEPSKKRKPSDPPEEIELPLPPPVKSKSEEREMTPSKDLPLSFSYGLGGPVGKTGYISATGSDAGDPWDDGKGSSRRISKIAEVTATVMGFSRRQWMTIFVFGLADLFSAILISIQAPFYPAEAERKGATATEYGLVFGIFELVVFVMSPIYGKYMNKIGPKLVYNLGIFTTGTACILFGLLDKINDHTLFITFSFIIRICEAIGNAAFVTASFTIIAYEFPESVATTFASLETFFGLGLILGPTIGGALYQVGGYILPFAVTGTAVFITGIIASILMPKIEVNLTADGKCSEGYGILKILKIPSVALAAISIMMGANSIGFLNATLEPHLRQFSLTPLQTGLVFIINGGVYALTAPGFGWLCDKSSQPKYILLIGAILTFVSFLLIGPAPFIPLETTLWMTSVGLLVHGLSTGAILVSGFILALRDCLDNGLPDSISTYGVVSGLWTAMLSLGAFVGPSIGGVLLDNVGFRLGTLFILMGEVVVMVLVTLYICLSKKPKSKEGDTESQPLLSSSPKPGTSSQVQLKFSYGATGESDA